MADLVSPLAAISIGYNPDGALVGMAKQIGRPQTVELAWSGISSEAQQFWKRHCKGCMERPPRRVG